MSSSALVAGDLSLRPHPERQPRAHQAQAWERATSPGASRLGPVPAPGLLLATGWTTLLVYRWPRMPRRHGANAAATRRWGGWHAVRGPPAHAGNVCPVLRRLPTVESRPRRARARDMLTFHRVADPPCGALEHFVGGAFARLDGRQPPRLHRNDRGDDPGEHGIIATRSPAGCGAGHVVEPHAEHQQHGEHR